VKVNVLLIGLSCIALSGRQWCSG